MKRALALLAFVALIAGAGVTASGADFTHASASPNNSFATAADFNTVAVAMTDPGASLHGTVSLQATATSERGIATVTYQSAPTGTGTWTDACVATTAPFACDWNTAGVADGVRDLRAIAVDQAGYQRTSAVVAARRIDNTLPTVTLADPGAYLTGSETLSATGSDPGGGLASLAIEYRPAGGAWSTLCTGATSPRSCALNTAALADGTYELRARATDLAGNVADAVLNRVVDNTAPSGAIPPPGALRGTATVPITAADGSGSGVASVTGQFRQSGSTTWSQVCVDTDAPYECSGIDTTGYPDGLYEARAIVVDRAGFSTTTATITVRLDNTAPSSATLASPGTIVTGTKALSGTAADAGSGIAAWTAQYRATGTTTWSDACSDTTATYSCNWATTGVADGTYDLRAVARDQAGNTTASTVIGSVRVDNTAPSGTDIQATNGGATAGRLESGDRIVLTYSEAMAPASILTGWTGSSLAIRVYVTEAGTADKMDFRNSAGTTRLNLVNSATDLNLGGNFVSNATVFNATMVMSGSTVTVTLGSRVSGTVTTAAVGAMTWRPSATSRDLAGLAASTTLVTESGASDRDF